MVMDDCVLYEDYESFQLLTVSRSVFPVLKVVFLLLLGLRQRGINAYFYSRRSNELFTVFDIYYGKFYKQCPLL